MQQPKYAIGIDPDADKHGVAIYIDGRLVDLVMWQAISIVDFVKAKEGCVIGIEDVMANQFVYSRNRKSSNAAQSKVAMHIGRCQQAQVELMRLLDHHKLPYKKFPPQRGNWAKNKPQFEKVTGWSKRSNEDTRAAAFFGWLALRESHTLRPKLKQEKPC